MGDFDTINYAQIVGNAEQVKSQRMRNTLLGQSIEQNKNIIERRRKFRKIEEEHENRPARIAALHEAGMHEEARPLEEFHWQSLQNSFQAAENLSKVVTKENWKQTRENYINGGGNPAYMPVEYSSKWFKDEEKKTRKALTHFEETFLDKATGKTMTQSVTQDPNTEITTRLEPYETTSKTRPPAGSQPKALKPSDLNALYKFVANEFGGTFYRNPQTNELEIFLEGEDATRANDMALRAADLMGKGTALPQAIEQARQEVIPGGRRARTIGEPDPLNLLQRP